MRRSTGLLAFAVLVACSDSKPASAPSPPPPQQPPQSTLDARPAFEAGLAEAPLVGPPEAPSGTQGSGSSASKRGEWSNVVSDSSCFYFSGPSGRDTQLGDDIAIAIDGDRATVTWSGVVFEGTLREDVLDVKRRGRYDFSGPWTTSERLRGPFREGRLDGTYTYEECEVGTACPGRCTISARVVVE